MAVKHCIPSAKKNFAERIIKKAGGARFLRIRAQFLKKIY